jgi:hypothetical protein
MYFAQVLYMKFSKKSPQNQAGFARSEDLTLGKKVLDKARNFAYIGSALAFCNASKPAPDNDLQVY